MFALFNIVNKYSYKMKFFIILYWGCSFYLTCNTQLLTYNFYFGNEVSLIIIILLLYTYNISCCILKIHFRCEIDLNIYIYIYVIHNIVPSFVVTNSSNLKSGKYFWYFRYFRKITWGDLLCWKYHMRYSFNLIASM